MTISDVENLSRTPVDEVGAHRFTREDYEQMDFGPDRRVELLDGVIYDRSPRNALQSP